MALNRAPGIESLPDAVRPSTRSTTVHEAPKPAPRCSSFLFSCLPPEPCLLCWRFLLFGSAVCKRRCCSAPELCASGHQPQPASWLANRIQPQSVLHSLVTMAIMLGQLPSHRLNLSLQPRRGSQCLCPPVHCGAPSQHTLQYGKNRVKTLSMHLQPLGGGLVDRRVDPHRRVPSPQQMRGTSRGQRHLPRGEASRTRQNHELENTWTRFVLLNTIFNWRDS